MEVPVVRHFHLRKEVTTLGVSLFVLGLGLSQLVTGLMLETDGCNVVQHSFSAHSRFVCT